jgi:PKD domain
MRIEQASKGAARWCAPVMLLCAALALPSGAHAAGWLNAENVSPDGSNAGSPSVALNPGKDMFLVWTRGGAVEMGVRPAGGSFSVTSITGCSMFCLSAGQPDIAADGDGNAIVVWRQGGIRAAMRSPDGSLRYFDPLSSTSDVFSPQVAFTSDGTAVVVWRQSGSAYAAVRPPGGSFGAAVPIFEAPGENVTSAVVLATGGAGDAMAAFLTNDQQNETALRIVRRTPGGWELPETAFFGFYNPCSEVVAYLGSPAVAMDASGNAAAGVVEGRAIFDSQCDVAATATSMVARLRSAATGAWGPERTLDTAGGEDGVSDPALAFSSQGEAVAAWVRAPSAGQSSVRYAVAPPGSDGFGSTRDVPASASGDTSTPALAPLPGAATMLAFEHELEVRYSIRPAAGSFAPAVMASGSDQAPEALGIAADPAGDVAAAWIRPDESLDERVQSGIYDASPPVVSEVSVPASAEPRQSLAFGASATDAFSPFSFEWAFGDGANASGAQVSHAYASGGSFEARVSVADAAGNAAPPVTRSVTVGAPPGAAPGASVPDLDAPRFVEAISLARRVFRAAASGDSALVSRRRRRRPAGTTVTFRLDEAASVAFTVERAKRGRRVGRRCVKPTRSNRKRRKCRRYVLQRGGFTVPSQAGETRFRFTGRLLSRKLKPGTYRLAAFATDAAGNRSPAQRARFRIVRK